MNESPQWQPPQSGVGPTSGQFPVAPPAQQPTTGGYPMPAMPPQPTTGGYPVPVYGQQPPMQYAALPQHPKSLGGLATALTVLLSITGALSVLVAIASFNRASIIGDVTSVNVSLSEVDDADKFIQGSAGLMLVLVLATAVVWMIWQFRYAENAELYGARDGLGKGWAVGGLFIPLGNVILPQLQLANSAKFSERTGSVPPLVIIWWIAYDTWFLLFGISSGMRPDESEARGSTFTTVVDRFQAADVMTGIASLIGVAAAVIAILMVRGLSARQLPTLAAPAPAAW